MIRKPSAILISTLLSSVQVFATFTPTAPRGEQNITHTSPRGIQEVCVIPSKYPEADYKKKDLKREQELCNYSFYDSNLANGEESTAICAKLNSTNPAINIFKTEDKAGKKLSKSAIEASGCKDVSKIGKYKNSTSCSYTPSIVGYYHLSRILGRIGRVPVSVLRTMDIETHKKIASQGKSGTKVGDLINTTWAGLSGNLNAGIGGAKKDLLLTDDGQQSYGGFIMNPKHEKFYGELFTKGPDRAVAFLTANPLMKLVKDERPLNQIVSSEWNQSNVQKLYAMKDITEFILMDHIMDQQDRFGNIAAQSKQIYIGKDDAADQDYDVQTGDADDYKKDLAEGLVDKSRAPLTINLMTLKDNDCGVSKSNVVKAAQLLKYVRHMSPKTYKKLLQFQASVVENKKFFTSNLMFTTKDFDEMVANVNDAVMILQTNCNRGVLKLDLDVDHYLETGSLKQGSCTLK